MATDAVSGSDLEHRVVDDLVAFFEGYSDFDVERFSHDVLLWEDRYCSLDGFRCISLPPVGSSSVRGRLVDRLEESSGNILIYSTTDNPDNVWNIYNLALESGAEAVVFYDYYPGRVRRIVVTGVWGYSYHDRSNISIPAIHIRLEDGVRLLRRKLGSVVEIDVDARLSRSTGYTVRARYSGREDLSIAVAGHHDRWFNGFRDNQISLEVLKSIASKLYKLSRSGKTPRYSIDLISFSAEEFGDPNMPSWYWAYGSRDYLGRGGLGDAFLAIVVDTAYREPVRIKYSYPDIFYRVVKDNEPSFRYVTEGYGHAFTDASSLTLYGVPSITLYNLEDMYDIYHTDLDLWFPYFEIVAKIASWITDLALTLTPRSDLGERFINDVKSKLPHDLAREFESLAKRDLDLDAFKCLIKNIVKPTLIGDFRDLYNDIELTPLPEGEALKAFRESSSNEVWVCGEHNTKLYDPRDRGSESSYLSLVERALDNIARCVKK